MKKLCLLLIIILEVFMISSCESTELKIENYEWSMSCAVYSEGDDFVVEAVGEADHSNTDAKIVTLTLVAENGVITITDATNSKVYTGTYSIVNITPNGTNYNITIDGKTGYAGVAMTAYADGSEKPTMPINLGNYSIYFYAQ